MGCKSTPCGPLEERKAIANSVWHFFRPQLTSSTVPKEENEKREENQIMKDSSYMDLVGWTKLRIILEEYFPSCNDSMSSSNVFFPADLADAIKKQLQERHLQCLPRFMEKVVCWFIVTKGCCWVVVLFCF